MKKSNQLNQLIEKEKMKEELAKPIQVFGNLLASSTPVATIEDMKAYNEAIKLCLENVSQIAEKWAEIKVKEANKREYTKGYADGCRDCYIDAIKTTK